MFSSVFCSKTEAAKAVGAAVAKKALEKGIDKVVFDRGGNLYHGRIQALAEGAREAGVFFLANVFSWGLLNHVISLLSLELAL